MTCNIDKETLQYVVDKIKNTPACVMEERLAQAETSTVALSVNAIITTLKGKDNE